MASTPSHPPKPKPRQRTNITSEPKSVDTTPELPRCLQREPSDIIYEEPIASIRPMLRVSQHNSASLSLDEEAGEEEERDHDRESPPYIDINTDQREAECTFLSSNDEEDDVGFTGFSIRGGSSIAPSIRLYNHPVLKKSASANPNDAAPTHGSLTDLSRKVYKPKNRAPPPPPGAVTHAGSVPREMAGEKLSNVGETTTPLDAVSGEDGTQVVKRTKFHHQRSKSMEFLDDDDEGGLAVPGKKLNRLPLQDQRSIQHGGLSPTSAIPIPTASQGQRSPGPLSPSTAQSIFAIQQQRRRYSDQPISYSHQQQEASPRTSGITRLGGVYEGGTGSAPPSPSKVKSKGFVPTHPPPHGHKGAPPSVQSSNLPKVSDQPDQSLRSHFQQPSPYDHDQFPCSSPTPSVKPKRQAPPPPVAGGMRSTANASPEDATGREDPNSPPPPIYSEVMKGLTRKEDELTSATSPMQDAYEEVLKTMDLFTIELEKGVNEDVGLVLVGGNIRSGRGFMVSGVFVEQVVPGSSAEQDGRIQAGDMVTQVFSYEVKDNLDEAMQFLEIPSASVRVKVGRPDMTSSVFRVQDGIEEQVYTNPLVGPSYEEMLEKLEQIRLRSDEHEREKEMVIKELKTFREQALMERQILMQELEEARESEPIYTNQPALEPDYEEMLEKLKQSRLKSVEHEREKETTFKELQAFREEALKERNALVKELEETEQAAEGELECHKAKLEDLGQQLEQEKIKAEKDLQAIKTCLMETQERLKKQEDKESSSQHNEAVTKELQEELSKYKEDNSRLLAELATEKEKIAELETRLKSTKDDLRLEKEISDRLQVKMDSQALQIYQFRLEIEGLHDELKKVKSSAAHSTELRKKELPVPLRKSPPSSTKAERRRVPSPAHERSDTEACPDSPLSEEDILVQENSDVSDAESNTGDEDAFDDHSPSPVVPCPYIDFVPLQMPDESKEGKEVEEDKKQGKRKEEDKREEKEAEETSLEKESEDLAESGEGSTNATNGGENESALGEDSGRGAAEGVVGKEDGLEAVDGENTETGTEKPKEDQEVGEEEEEVDEKKLLSEFFGAIKPHQVLDNSAAVYKSKMKMGGHKRKLPSRDHIRKKDGRGDILHNMPSASLSDLTTPLEEPTPVVNDEEGDDMATEDHSKDAKDSPHPKPRPKAAPRKKPVLPPAPSSSADQGKKQPLAAPRLRSSQDSEEAESEGKDSGAGDKAVSHGQSRSNETSAPESPAKKDPSKLSLKNKKALLAQNILMNPQDKNKPGAPFVHRKPKPVPTTPAGSGSDPAESRNELAGAEHQRGPTAEEGDNVKPNRGKKLPPGAFNMMKMGGVPIMKPGSSPERTRAATVSTSLLSNERELTQDHVGMEDREGGKESGENEQDIRSRLQAKLRKTMSVDDDSGSDAGSKHNSPLTRPKIKKRSGSTADDGANTSPLTHPKLKNRSDSTADDGTDSVEGGGADANVVLTWTPDVTAAWLCQIELASHQQTFLEKGIQGYMLFDMDAHKLKSMGMVSHEDRNIFKKEIKNLKPFADKQKKLMEKLRKEEKKLAKKKKK